MFMQVIPTKVVLFKGNNITGQEGKLIKLRVKSDDDLHHIINTLIWSNVWDFQVRKEEHNMHDFTWLDEEDYKDAVSNA